MNGYVIGLDNEKMYSIIIDEQERKTYEFHVELDLISNRNEIEIEKMFELDIKEDGSFNITFIDDYINKDISIDDLKNNIGID